MKLYRMLTGPDDATFCHKVSAALDKGWDLFGNPAYAFNAKNGEMQCAQAVVKELYGQTYQPEIKLSDQ